MISHDYSRHELQWLTTRGLEEASDDYEKGLKEAYNRLREELERANLKAELEHTELANEKLRADLEREKQKSELEHMQLENEKLRADLEHTKLENALLTAHMGSVKLQDADWFYTHLR